MFEPSAETNLLAPCSVRDAICVTPGLVSALDCVSSRQTRRFLCISLCDSVPVGTSKPQTVKQTCGDGGAAARLRHLQRDEDPLEATHGPVSVSSCSLQLRWWALPRLWRPLNQSAGALSAAETICYVRNTPLSKGPEWPRNSWSAGGMTRREALGCRDSLGRTSGRQIISVSGSACRNAQ